jgi:hypothetical protein
MNRDFLRWIGRLFRTSRHGRESFLCQRVETLPARLSDMTLYVLGDDECEWAAAMRCPCGCGSTIHLSLARDATPSWIVRRHRDGTASLLPSVWRTVGCKSHFVLYRGLIFWCRNMPDFPHTTNRW